jgi:hypothetical protein
MNDSTIRNKISDRMEVGTMRRTKVDGLGSEAKRNNLGGTSSRPFSTKKEHRLRRIALIVVGLLLSGSTLFPGVLIPKHSSGSDGIDKCRIPSNATFSVSYEFSRVNLLTSTVPRLAGLLENQQIDIHVQHLRMGHHAGGVSYYAFRDEITAEDFAKRLAKTVASYMDFSIRRYGQIVVIFHARTIDFANMVDPVFEEINQNSIENGLITQSNMRNMGQPPMFPFQS